MLDGELGIGCWAVKRKKRENKSLKRKRKTQGSKETARYLVKKKNDSC